MTKKAKTKKAKFPVALNAAMILTAVEVPAGTLDDDGLPPEGSPLWETDLIIPYSEARALCLAYRGLEPDFDE